MGHSPALPCLHQARDTPGIAYLEEEEEEDKGLLSKVSPSMSRHDHNHGLTQSLVVSQPDPFFYEVFLTTASPFSHLISPGTPRGYVISL